MDDQFEFRHDGHDLTTILVEGVAVGFVQRVTATGQWGAWGYEWVTDIRCVEHKVGTYATRDRASGAVLTWARVNEPAPPAGDH